MKVVCQPRLRKLRSGPGGRSAAPVKLIITRRAVRAWPMNHSAYVTQAVFIEIVDKARHIYNFFGHVGNARLWQVVKVVRRNANLPRGAFPSTTIHPIYTGTRLGDLYKEINASRSTHCSRHCSTRNRRLACCANTGRSFPFHLATTIFLLYLGFKAIRIRATPGADWPKANNLIEPLQPARFLEGHGTELGNGTVAFSYGQRKLLDRHRPKKCPTVFPPSRPHTITTYVTDRPP